MIIIDDNEAQVLRRLLERLTGVGECMTTPPTKGLNRKTLKQRMATQLSKELGNKFINYIKLK